MKRLKSFDKNSILHALIVITALTAIFLLYMQLRGDRVTDALKKGETLRVLFIIRDGDQPRVTQSLVYHPVTNRGALIDIPGNIGLIIESLKRFDRIDVLYRKGNSGAFRSRIESLLGIDIPFYIETDYSGLRNLVDLVEGLDVFIANPVEELQGGTKTLLPSGSVRLDGSKILSYMTYEDADELEVDAINRRQRVIQSLLKQVGNSVMFLEHRDVLPYLKASITTNMDTRALLSFIGGISELDAEHMVFHRVLGANRTVDDQILLFPHFDGNLLKETVSQTLESLANTDRAVEPGQLVTLQILNGTSTPGLARRTANLFLGFGYAGSKVGNWDSRDEAYTRVIDRRGDPAAAQRIADLIRCRRVESVSGGDPDDSIDITIILGKDFDGRFIKE